MGEGNAKGERNFKARPNCKEDRMNQESGKKKELSRENTNGVEKIYILKKGLALPQAEWLWLILGVYRQFEDRGKSEKD